MKSGRPGRNFRQALTEKRPLETIKQFIEAHPELDIYYGEGFSVGAFSGEEVSLGPKKERLDEICPDKPVIIYSLDGHITWLNSAALKKFNITEETLDPPGGRIERDPISGKLWDGLKEAAQTPTPSQEFSFEVSNIDVGKLADLVVLDQNILKVDLLKIGNACVLKRSSMEI